MKKLAGKCSATEQDKKRWAKELFGINPNKSYRVDAKDVGKNRYRINVWEKTVRKDSVVDKYNIAHSCYIVVDKEKNIVYKNCN